MIPDQWKEWLLGSSRREERRQSVPVAAHPALRRDELLTRTSNALDQFFSYIRGREGLTVLDLGEANQANVNFVTSLGHRLCSEDLLRSCDQRFGNIPPDSSLLTGEIESFLQDNLAYEDAQFDGVLAWNVLEHLHPALFGPVVDRLLRITQEKSYLLCCFSSQEKVDSTPYYSFRVKDSRTLILIERARRTPPQSFNNRRLERLFEGCESVKFFLSRDSLREVIVKR